MRIVVDARSAWNEDLLRVGPLGKALWFDGLCYASLHGTNGHLSAVVVDHLIEPFREFVDVDAIRTLREPVQWLVNAGLWTLTNPDDELAGYDIEDFFGFCSDD